MTLTIRITLHSGKSELICYLYKYVNLRSRIKFSPYSGSKGLFQVCGHLSAFAVTPGSLFPLSHAKRCCAVLTIDKCFVMQCFGLGTPNL